MTKLRIPLAVVFFLVPCLECEIPGQGMLRRDLGNTCYFILVSEFYLLGILSSWATWFFISKTCQPLRLRGDRWQYRLFTQ